MQSLATDYRQGLIPFSKLKLFQTELQYGSLLSIEGQFPLKCHLSGINSLDISNDLLLSGGADTCVKLWDVSTDQLNPIHASAPRKYHKFGISTVKWWPNDTGLFLSASFDESVQVWDTSTFSSLHKFALDSKVFDIDVSSVGTHALVAAGMGDSHIRLLDLNSTSTAQSLTAHKGKVLSVRWSPRDPYILASGGVDGELKLWDIRRAKSCVCSLDQFNVASESNVTVSPSKRSTSVKDISSVKFQFNDNSPKSHVGTINSILFNNQGNKVISLGNDDKIKVWDLTAPNGVNMMVNFGPIVKNRHPLRISPCLSPKSETELEYLWFPNDNGEILVFELETGRLISRLNKHHLQRNTRGFNKNISKTSGYVLNQNRATSIVYAGHNSATYFSGSLDGSISIWGPGTSRPPPIFRPNADYIDDEDSDLESNEQEPNVLDSIHNEMEARTLMSRNPFI